MSLVNEKRYDDALVQFRLLETQFPRHPQGFTGEAVVLALTGESQRAVDILKKALEIAGASGVGRPLLERGTQARQRGPTRTLGPPASR